MTEKFCKIQNRNSIGWRENNIHLRMNAQKTQRQMSVQMQSTKKFCRPFVQLLFISKRKQQLFKSNIRAPPKPPTGV
jgi:hypothetical protein